MIDIKFDFEVNEWGSCQYAKAKTVYDKYFELRKNHNFKKTCDLLDINIKAKNIQSIEKVKKLLIADHVDELLDSSDEEHDKYLVNSIKQIHKSKDADELFSAYRDLSYDLWCTSSLLANSFFKYLKIENVEQDKDGKGPPLNKEVQSSNSITGLYCALLIEFSIVKHEESFHDFST